MPDKFSTAYKSVTAFGIVRPITGEEKATALLAIAKKYCCDYMERAKNYVEKSAEHVGVYQMEIVRITGKSRPDR